jgi:hypothetical protein
LNFKAWLETQNDKEHDWIHPDMAYTSLGEDKRTRPFIYTDEGKIYYGGQSDTHYDVTTYNDDLEEKFKDYRTSGNYFDRDEAAQDHLFGRISTFITDEDKSTFYSQEINDPNTDILLVSFWGSNIRTFNNLLLPCLKQLEKDGLINMKRDAVSTINHKTLFIRDLNKGKEASDEDIENHRNQLALHLMGAKEKKKELAKRGFTGSPPSPYNSAARKAGITRPGQNIYALQSDWVKYKL